jgi:hypothetical protein
VTTRQRGPLAAVSRSLRRQGSPLPPDSGKIRLGQLV